jgi:hypothetical protein
MSNPHQRIETMKDIVTEAQVLELKPGYTDDFPARTTSLRCPDKMAPVLEKMGYCCIEIYRQHCQICYVFERDPWESQIAIRIGQFSDTYADYCQTGNIENVE